MKTIKPILVIFSMLFMLYACSDEQETNGELVAQELQKVFNENKIEQVICVKANEPFEFKRNIPISIKGTFLYIGEQQSRVYNLEQLISYHITEEYYGNSKVLAIYLYFP